MSERSAQLTDADVERLLFSAGARLVPSLLGDVVPAALQRIRSDAPTPRPVASSSNDNASQRRNALCTGTPSPLLQRPRRRELLRVVLAACAVLLVGATLTVLTNRPERQAAQPLEPSEPAPFELPGYRYVGAVDLSPFGVAGRPPFPLGIAFADNDVLVVGEAGSMRVLALTRGGSLIHENQVAEPPNPADLDAAHEQTGTWSSVAQGFGDAIDVAAGSDGVVYASSRLAHRVYRIESDGRISTTWNPPIDLDAGLFSTSFITADAAGNVYYGEPYNCTIGVLRSDGSAGSLVRPDPGKCLTQFADLQVVGDRIYAAATPAGDVSGVAVYDLAGQRLDDIVVRGAPADMLDTLAVTMRVAVDQRGNLILITAGLREREGQPPDTVYSMLIVSPAGDLLAMAELPATELQIDIAVAPDGTLALLDRDSTEILLFEPDGEALQPVAPFELAGYEYAGAVDVSPFSSAELPVIPQGLALGTDDVLYVGDASLMRVLALRGDGTLAFETQVGEPPDRSQLLELYERVARDWSSVALAVDGRISLASAPDGNLYAGGELGLRVHQITPQGHIAATWRPPIDFESGLTSAGFLAAGDDAVYFSERDSCGFGVLKPGGAAEVLTVIDDCPPRTPNDLAVAGERLYFVFPTEDRNAIVVSVYDLGGQLTEEIVVGGSTDLPGVTNAFPMRILVDNASNLLILTTTILGRDDDGLLTEVHLLTVSPTGDMLATSELPDTDGWVDVDIAPDGTFGVLYRDSTEVLLFEPVSR